MPDENDYDRVPIQRTGATAVQDAPAAPDSTPDSSQYTKVPIQRAPVALKPSSEYDRVPIQRGPSEHDPSYSSSPIPKDYGFTPSNVGSAIYDAAGNIIKAGYGMGKDLISSKTPVLLSDEKPDAPISERMQGDTLLNKYVLGPANEEKRKAEQAFTQGNMSEAIGHTAAEYLPVLGPIAAHLGERAGTGDIGGAAAEGTTYALAPKIAENTLPVVKGVTKAVAEHLPVVRDIYGAVQAAGEARRGIPRAAADATVNAVKMRATDAGVDAAIERGDLHGILQSIDNPIAYPLGRAMGKVRDMFSSPKEAPAVPPDQPIESANMPKATMGKTAPTETAPESTQDLPKIGSAGGPTSIMGKSRLTPSAEVSPVEAESPSMARLGAYGREPRVIPGVKMSEQNTAPAAPIEAEHLGQFVRTNGPEIDAAISKEFKSPEDAQAVRDQLHAVSNSDLRKLAVEEGVLQDGVSISRSKTSAGVERAEVWRELLRKLGGSASNVAKALAKRTEGEAGPKGTVGEPFESLGTRQLNMKVRQKYANTPELLKPLSDADLKKITTPKAGQARYEQILDAWPEATEADKEKFANEVNYLRDPAIGIREKVNTEVGKGAYGVDRATRKGWNEAYDVNYPKPIPPGTSGPGAVPETRAGASTTSARQSQNPETQREPGAKSSTPQRGRPTSRAQALKRLQDNLKK